mgnify:CR=1 FL=1
MRRAAPCLAALAAAALTQVALAGGVTDAVPGRQAEAFYDPAAVQAARARLKARHGGGRRTFVMLDRLEYAHGGAVNDIVFEGQAWHGSDLHKAWFKTEGEYAPDAESFEEAELQLLYSRAIASFWDVQAGVRMDPAPDHGTRASAVIGVIGLAPYWFEVDLAAFLTGSGVPSVRLEIEYGLSLTQRLILQPRVEVNAAADDAGTTGDDGVGEFEAALRLRYEIRREFAPYLGVGWGHAFEGADSRGDWTLLAGVRIWY